MGWRSSVRTFPMWTEATTIDHGTTGLAMPVPSPSSSNIPEPSVLVLAFFGLVGFALQPLGRFRLR